VVAAGLVEGVAAAFVGGRPGPFGGIDPAAAAAAVEVVDDVRIEFF
jgi:hypothetical protein